MLTAQSIETSTRIAALAAQHENPEWYTSLVALSYEKTGNIEAAIRHADETVQQFPKPDSVMEFLSQTMFGEPFKPQPNEQPTQFARPTEAQLRKAASGYSITSQSPKEVTFKTSLGEVSIPRKNLKLTDGHFAESVYHALSAKHADGGESPKTKKARQPKAPKTDKPAESAHSGSGSHHAPAGGVTIGGKQFKGGEFIPGEDFAKATSEQQAAIREGKPIESAEPPKEKPAEHSPAEKPQPSPNAEETTKPEPNLEPEPATTEVPGERENPEHDALHQGREAVIRRFSDLLAKHSHIPVKKRAAFEESVRDVTQRMPTKALAAMEKHIEDVHWQGSWKDLTKEIRRRYPHQKSRLRGVEIGGAWFHSIGSQFGKLFLDGEGGSGSTAAHDIYAHEFGHIVDWDSDAKTHISSGVGWKFAWRSEINIHGAPLSAYASSSATEGFAEFHRLLYAGGLEGEPPIAKQKFPLCWAIFEQHGLIPEQEKDLPAHPFHSLPLSSIQRGAVHEYTPDEYVGVATHPDAPESERVRHTKGNVRRIKRQHRAIVAAQHNASQMLPGYTPIPERVRKHYPDLKTL